MLLGGPIYFPDLRDKQYRMLSSAVFSSHYVGTARETDRQTDTPTHTHTHTTHFHSCLYMLKFYICKGMVKASPVES